MAKRTYILMGVLVLLAGALLASAVLAQEPDSPPTAEEGETYPEEAVRDQLDEDGKIVTTDDRLAKVAKDHSGGFGGYYFDKTIEGQVFVFMTDPSQTNAARDAFQAAYKGNRTVTQITPIKGEYAFDDLLTWFRTLDRAMLADGIYPSAGAAREIQNRIWFALEDIGQVDTILELMRSLEIPEGAVIFEEAHSELLSGEDDVQSKWRPLVGGVKFQIKFGQPVRHRVARRESPRHLAPDQPGQTPDATDDGATAFTTSAIYPEFPLQRHPDYGRRHPKLVITNLCVPPVGTADRARRHDQGRPNMGRAPFLVSLEMVAFATLLVL